MNQTIREFIVRLTHSFSPVAPAMHPEAPGRVRALCVGKNQAVAFSNANGLRVECASGILWITHDGDLRDVILSGGEQYISGLADRMVIFGLEDAEATVSA
jgi:hypothetical protein